MRKTYFLPRKKIKENKNPKFLCATNGRLFFFSANSKKIKNLNLSENKKEKTC